MLSYCLKCSKNTESKDPKVATTINGRIMLLLKCTLSDKKNQNLLNKKKLMDY